MLEVLFIVLVSKYFGEKAMDKGYSRGLFRGMAVGAWLTGETIGIIVLSFIAVGSFLVRYLLSLGGAIGGAALLGFILFLLPEKDLADGTGIAKAWACPACGFRNTGWRSRCFKCNAVRPEEKAIASRAWTCPGCGKPNLASDDFCYQCKKAKSAGA